VEHDGGGDLIGNDRLAEANREAATAIENYINTLGLTVTALTVTFDGATSIAKVFGVAKDQATKEKVILAAGNVHGVAGVQDMRFQELMPDALHWLGITKIDRLISMSDMKHDAIVGSGIRVLERVPIPDGLIPKDAQVEMEAKKAAGYYAPAAAEPPGGDVAKGRALDD